MKYYVYVNHEFKLLQSSQCKPAIIGDLPNLFTHPNTSPIAGRNAKFSVSERRSGLKVASGDTRLSAIENARTAIWRWSESRIEALQDRVNASIRGTGISPAFYPHVTEAPETIEDTEIETPCYNCNQPITGDAVIRNDESYCEDCFNEQFATCEDCGATHYYENLAAINDEYYCKGCRTTCYDCDELVIDTHWINNEEICDRCVDDNYSSCENCNTTTHFRNMNDNGLCDSCHENQNESHIKSYSTDVLDFCSKDDAKRLFGVELEVASESSVDWIAWETADLVQGDAILKEDSSIATGNYEGFEIVTRPMTLANQLAFWDRTLDRCSKELRSYDVVKSDGQGSCGLHIHVTKDSISELTLGKLLVFVNSPANMQLIKKVAQRYNCGFSSAKTKRITDAKQQNSDRYEFINTQPRNTVEFRLFRGTMNKVRLSACLEFTSSLIEYCEQASISKLYSDDFLTYVKKQPKLNNLKTLLSIQVDPAVENPLALPAMPPLHTNYMSANA